MRDKGGSYSMGNGQEKYRNTSATNRQDFRGNTQRHTAPTIDVTQRIDVEAVAKRAGYGINRDNGVPNQNMVQSKENTEIYGRFENGSVNSAEYSENMRSFEPVPQRTQVSNVETVTYAEPVRNSAASGYAEPVVASEPMRHTAPVTPAEPTRYTEPVIPAEPVEMPNPTKKKSKKWIIWVVASVVACVGIFFGIMEIQRSRAQSAYDEGEYVEAKEIYSSVSFYRDSEEKMKQCDYAEATRLLENDNGREAQKIFESIRDYSDSDFMIMECMYVVALDDFAHDRILEAYENMIILADKDYKDSRIKLKAVINELYNKGVSEYRNNNIEGSKKCFENYVEGSKNAGLSVDMQYKDYLRLITARETVLNDVSDIYDLIGFEDTKEILLSNKYILSFLKGVWIDKNENKLEFYDDENGNGVKYYSTLPTTSKGSYKLENGIQKHGSDEDGWTEEFEYKIISEDIIEVYCYKNDKTYTMYRQ